LQRHDLSLSVDGMRIEGSYDSSVFLFPDILSDILLRVSQSSPHHHREEEVIDSFD
jgi:hypothetical protein